MQLNKFQEERIEELLLQVRENMIEDLLNKNIGEIVDEIMGKPVNKFELFDAVQNEFLNRLFKWKEPNGK